MVSPEKLRIEQRVIELEDPAGPGATQYNHRLVLSAYFAFGVFHVLKGKINVALRRHQLKAVANGEFIFHRYRREVPLALTGKLTNKLLAVRN